MISAYIALGSNLDNPQARVCQAFKQLNEIKNSRVVAQSSLYITKPWGMTDQPDFINAVVKLETSLAASALLAELLALEQMHGRVRREKNGPRTLDCDILLYGNLTIKTPELTIPHPEMHRRAFVLVPLAEIEPTLKLLNKPITEWLTLCKLSNSR